MSMVTHFLRATFNCSTYASLAKRVIDSLHSLGLDVSIEIFVSGEHHYFCSSSMEYPLEDSVFEFVRNKGRILDFGAHTVINYPHITVIIRNMPLSKPDLYGRIKDYLALIAQGANSKIISLESDLLHIRQHTNLLAIINETQSTLTSLDQEYQLQQFSNESIMTEILGDVEQTFLKLGLSEGQEQSIRNILEKGSDKSRELYGNGLCLEHKFDSILNKMQHVVKSNLIQVNDEQNEDNCDDSVEIF